MATTALSSTRKMAGPVDLSALAELVSGEGLRSVFQPIVDIDTLQPVAFEALSRGPQGTSLETPDAFLSAAYSAGLAAEIDWACRRSAYRAALEAGLDQGTTLFVNVEPATLGTPAPANVAELQGRALQRLRVVLEVTERVITSRPAEILGAAQWARSHGWGVALDDLGANPGSLALLPLLRPDVVKLDLRLVHARPDREIATIMTAVSAYAEQTGAALLAEGIETPEHLMTARALGMRYGQGYLFGRPAPMPTTPPDLRGGVTGGGVQFLVPADLPVAGNTPFEVVAARRPVRPSTKPMLVEMAKHLEAEAAALSTPAVVLSAFQDAQHFTGDTVHRYEALGRTCPLVVAMGAGLPPEPVAGVRGANIGTADILAGEWSTLIVGAHYAGALVARDLGDSGPEHSRRFDYALTHDRSLVLDAAATLMRRVLPR